MKFWTTALGVNSLFWGIRQTFTERDYLFGGFTMLISIVITIRIIANKRLCWKSWAIKDLTKTEEPDADT